MLNPEKSRLIIDRLRKRRAATYSGQDKMRLFVFVSGTLQEILNPDGKSPYIRELKIREKVNLFAMGRIKENTDVYSAHIVGQQPSLNQDFRLTVDGENLYPFKAVIRKNLVGEGWELILEGKIGGSSVLAPATDPTADLVLSGSVTRAYGDPSPIVLHWSVNRGTAEIVSIVLTDATLPPITGNSQSGSVSLAPNVSENQIYTLYVEDANSKSVTKSITVKRVEQYYWGRYPGGTLSAEQLALLDGANFGRGREFYTGSLDKKFVGMDGQNQYLVWALPSGRSVQFRDAVFDLPIEDMVLVQDGLIANEFGYLVSLQVFRTRYLQAGIATGIRVSCH